MFMIWALTIITDTQEIYSSHKRLYLPGIFLLLLLLLPIIFLLRTKLLELRVHSIDYDFSYRLYLGVILLPYELSAPFLLHLEKK